MEQTSRSGDSNFITRKYFDSLLLEMRHIDSVRPNTELPLYGYKFSTPVMMAALSHLDKCHENGIIEMAKGALAANAVMWAGMGSYDELARITDTGAKTIKIVKPYADNEVVLKSIENASKCGCIAVGMDIDHSFNSKGEYDTVFGLQMAPKSLEDIKLFVRSTKLPFVIKGVLSVQDTLKCVEAGVQGIVVSHHHGIMDYAAPPLAVLPDIKRAIDGKMPIFVDCCVENGYDVFKALALGATAASVGRAVMGPLSAEGAYGVKKLIGNITSQLAGAMARTCSHSIGSIDPSIIRKGILV